MSELLKAVANITETLITTTMGHNARSNGIIEVFWRFWNRCMRLLPDDHYSKWPSFAARIAFAYNTAPHQSLGGISPYELYHDIAARDTLSAILNESTEHLVQLPDEAGDIENARLFAIAVRTSTTAFVQLARNHDQYLKNETAATLNNKGFPRSFIVGIRSKLDFLRLKLSLKPPVAAATTFPRGEAHAAS